MFENFKTEIIPLVRKSLRGNFESMMTALPGFLADKKDAKKILDLIIAANNRNLIENPEKALKEFVKEYGGDEDVFVRADEMLVTFTNEFAERLQKTRAESLAELKVNDNRKMKKDEGTQLYLPESFLNSKN